MTDEEYLALEAVDWDGKSPIWLDRYDELVPTPSDAFARVSEIEFDNDLRHSREVDLTNIDVRGHLLIARQECAKIDYEWFSDMLPEDVEELPAGLASLIEEFNEKTKSFPLSWGCSNKRLKVNSNDQTTR